jgi:hypothetical protein
MEKTKVSEILLSYPEINEWFDSIPEELKFLAKNIKKRLKKEKDLVIAITGHEEGIGKSSFSILLGFLIDMINFDLRQNIAYIANSDTIKKQFWDIPQESYLSLDEAIKALYKMDFNSQLQKLLIMMYATERWQKKCTGLCIPRFNDLTEQFRNHKVRLWIKIMKRGYAVVHTKDVDDDYDPWKLEWERKYREKNWSGRHVVDISFAERMKLERAKSTFVTEFRIPELPRILFNRYEEIKKEIHSKESQEDDDESARIHKYKETIFKLCQHIKMIQPDATIPKLSAIMGLNDSTLRDIINKFGKIEDFRKSQRKNRIMEQLPNFAQKVS